MSTTLLQLALLASLFANMALAFTISALVAGWKRSSNASSTSSGRRDPLDATQQLSRRAAIIELSRRQLPPQTISAVTGASRGEIQLALRFAKMKKGNRAA